MIYCNMLENDIFQHTGQVQKTYTEFLNAHTGLHTLVKKNLKKFKVVFRKSKHDGITELREIDIQFQKKPEVKIDKRAITSRTNGKNGGRPCKTEYEKLVDVLKTIVPDKRDSFCWAALNTLSSYEDKKREKERKLLAQADFKMQQQRNKYH